MSKPISNAQLKKNLTGKPEQIATMIRALPMMIQAEYDNPHPDGKSPSIIKKLQKNLDMVIRLQQETV